MLGAALLAALVWQNDPAALLASIQQLLTATVIEAVSTSIRFATFMVPASLGALEGGHVALFAALGAGAGMSFSVVRRLREATWIGIGFVALAAYRGLAPAPPSRTAAAPPGS